MCRQPFFVKPYFYRNIEPEYQKSEIRDYRKLKEIGIKMSAMLEADMKNDWKEHSMNQKVESINT